MIKLLSRSIVSAAGIFLLLPAALCQHKTTHTNMLWLGYHCTVEMGPKWTVLADAQLRTREWTSEWSQLAIRAGIGYKLNERFSLAAGFTLFKNAQYIGQDPLFKNEWRPWQDLWHKVQLKKVLLTQRVRTEQRFLQEVINNRKVHQYDFIFRLRYRVNMELPIVANKWTLGVGNEIMVNPEYISNTRFFDQNRTFAGLQYKINSTTAIQCLYMKIFQWRSMSNTLENQDVLRLNINQQLSRRANNTRKLTAKHDPAAGLFIVSNDL